MGDDGVVGCLLAEYSYLQLAQSRREGGSD